ncbi:hypothetical protein [Microvirga sp. G4-2]|uniref:hypothetical protein n=1 Tax=Microvirga sp. G4-2 TaxID=3434467 RepID=UPI004043FA11
MADITQIQLRLVTASASGRPGGSEGDIFLGIAGREFAVGDGRGQLRHEDDGTYMFGEGASVPDAEFNDPRSPQLDTLNVYKFPTYIRFEPRTPDDNWLLSLVEVIVRSPEADEICIEIGPVGAGQFWLGQTRGKIVHLWPPEPLPGAASRED